MKLFLKNVLAQIKPKGEERPTRSFPAFGEDTRAKFGKVPF